MKVVILCGGLGTRLREETEFRPKPMVPIGGRPILWHIMKLYAHYGHKHFILCLGYKGELIKEFFRNYHWNTSDVTLSLGKQPRIQYHSHHDEEDWTVTLIDTGQSTQTGGRIKRVLPYVGEDNFLLTYGDGLADSNINETIEAHLASKKLATLTAVHPTGRFGDLAVTDDGTITAFNEKPDQQAAPINGGFFVVNKAIGDYIDKDECVFERDVLPRLASEGKLGAHVHRGFWQCMDTYREQVLLDQMWQAGNAPWKIW
jgi:glucose-1-phosphate cytidylyltransferase